MMMSPYLLAIILGWIVAQGFKYVYMVVRHRKFSHVRQLYLSGNMPSAHSASVIALSTIIALRDGVSGSLFALSLLFAAIVMYDAVMVRRSSGEQGVAIQQIIKKEKLKIDMPRAAKGHTPLEVLCGALLGLVIGVVVYIATK